MQLKGNKTINSCHLTYIFSSTHLFNEYLYILKFLTSESVSIKMLLNLILEPLINKIQIKNLR